MALLMEGSNHKIQTTFNFTTWVHDHINVVPGQVISILEQFHIRHFGWQHMIVLQTATVNFAIKLSYIS